MTTQIQKRICAVVLAAATLCSTASAKAGVPIPLLSPEEPVGLWEGLFSWLGSVFLPGFPWF